MNNLQYEYQSLYPDRKISFKVNHYLTAYTEKYTQWLEAKLLDPSLEKRVEALEAKVSKLEGTKEKRYFLYKQGSHLRVYLNSRTSDFKEEYSWSTEKSQSYKFSDAKILSDRFDAWLEEVNEKPCNL